jgi:hypothetical protein
MVSFSLINKTEEELILHFENLNQKKKQKYLQLLMESISKDSEKEFHSKNILKASKKILSPNIFEFVPIEIQYEIFSYIGDLEELMLTTYLVSKDFHELTKNFVMEEKFGKNFTKEFTFQQLICIYNYYSSLIPFKFNFPSQDGAKNISFVNQTPCPVKSTIIGFNFISVADIKGFTINMEIRKPKKIYFSSPSRNYVERLKNRENPIHVGKGRIY